MPSIETDVLAHVQSKVHATVDGIARELGFSHAEVAEALASLAERRLIDRVGHTRWFTRIKLRHLALTPYAMSSS
jgi:DNA-binding IclR family transcriptional regulator